MTEPVPQRLIETLRLEPHPEGGWFRETWRAQTAEDERASATAIHFLLEAGQSSHWHRVDATELWLWHAGSPLALLTAPSSGGAIAQATLGGEVLAGQCPQVVVSKDHWQAARSLGGWALVSCVVSPGFEFSGFDLAPPGWEPGLS